MASHESWKMLFNLGAEERKRSTSDWKWERWCWWCWQRHVVLLRWGLKYTKNTRFLLLTVMHACTYVSGFPGDSRKCAPYFLKKKKWKKSVGCVCFHMFELEDTLCIPFYDSKSFIHFISLKNSWKSNLWIFFLGNTTQFEHIYKILYSSSEKDHCGTLPVTFHYLYAQHRIQKE